MAGSPPGRALASGDGGGRGGLGLRGAGGLLDRGVLIGRLRLGEQRVGELDGAGGGCQVGGHPLLLREQERQETERAERERLRELAKRYATERAAELFGQRVATAMARAAVQGNFSAIEAFAREAARAQEEEIFLLQATALAIELNG